MIKLTRLNGQIFYVNDQLIKFIESTPDTKLTFVNNDMILVREKSEDVLERIEKEKVHIGSQIELLRIKEAPHA